nr:BTB/POZ domain-containing protein 6-B-like isoform X2 [Lepeophtheirus salmonis]
MAGIKELCDSDNSDWQTEKKNLNEKCEFIYLNPLMSDVTFEVGSNDTKTITAHKLILSMGSPVFFTMFNGGFMESEKKENKIEVLDVEPEDFKSLLGYLYLDKITLNENNVAALLYCSHKYMIPLLTKRCSAYLLSIVKPSNAIYLMSQTRFFDLPVFRDKCWEVIVRDSKSAFESESFAKIDFETLLDVLRNKDLNYPQIVAFNAAILWATAQLKLKLTEKYEKNPRILGPKIRSLLGRAIDHICFSKMSSEEMCDIVVPSGILSADEIVCIFVKITSSNKTLEKNPKNIKVPFESQSWKLNKYTLFNGSHINSGAYSFFSALGFKVHRTVKIIGLTVLSGQPRDVLHINIKKNGTCCGKALLVCNDETPQQVYIKFTNEIILERDVEYKATAGCSFNKFNYYVKNEEPYFSPIFSITALPQNYNYITDIHYLAFRNS